MATTPYTWAHGELITAAELNTHTNALLEMQAQSSYLIAGQVQVTSFSSVSGGFFSGGAAYVRGSVAVTFPDGFFTTTPNVTVTAYSGFPGPPSSNSGSLEATASGVSTSGFTCYLARNSAANTNVFWVASTDT